MNRPTKTRRVGLTVLCAVAIWSIGRGASELPPAPTITNPSNALRTVRTASGPPPTPATAPPSPLSPIQRFRQLVAAPPEVREQTLKGRSEAHRRYLQERLAEFDALPEAERESRLRLLEFRYHLLPLMRSLPSERPGLLAQAPVADRPLLEERLRAWDTLPLEQQQELLANEGAVSQFAEFQSTAPARHPGLSAAQRQKLEANLDHWQQLPPLSRERVTRHFNQFFELSDRQKRKTLEKVSDSERTRTQAALAAFEKLPPDERARCVEALNRFAAMPPAERARFIRNAERWQALSPEERRAWRGVASRTALPPAPPPPLPRTIATNTQTAR